MEIQMWSTVREFAINIIFLSLISTMIYSSRDDHSFRQVQHLKQLFTPKQNVSQVCFRFSRQFRERIYDVLIVRL